MPCIDRCICTRRTFADLLAVARRDGLSLDQLAACTGASRHCGRCRPYLRRGLRTGETVFHQLLPAEDVAPADSARRSGEAATIPQP
ncbi:MAG: hypothetical protein ACODAQ_12915 [Phycisphaeraceae bacterium]